MYSSIFPGYPAFLEAAAAELGHPESVDPARRIAPLTALANLCAQASRGDRAHAAGILAKAAEFRDQLATALRAAELMLASVEAGLAPTPTPAPTPPPPIPLADPSEQPPGLRTTRRSPRTPRVPS